MAGSNIFLTSTLGGGGNKRETFGLVVFPPEAEEGSQPRRPPLEFVRQVLEGRAGSKVRADACTDTHGVPYIRAFFASDASRRLAIAGGHVEGLKGIEYAVKIMRPKTEHAKKPLSDASSDTSNSDHAGPYPAGEVIGSKGQLVRMLGRIDHRAVTTRRDVESIQHAIASGRLVFCDGLVDEMPPGLPVPSPGVIPDEGVQETNIARELFGDETADKLGAAAGSSLSSASSSSTIGVLPMRGKSGLTGGGIFGTTGSSVFSPSGLFASLSASPVGKYAASHGTFGEKPVFKVGDAVEVTQESEVRPEPQPPFTFPGPAADATWFPAVVTSASSSSPVFGERPHWHYLYESPGHPDDDEVWKHARSVGDGPHPLGVGPRPSEGVTVSSSAPAHSSSSLFGTGGLFGASVSGSSGPGLSGTMRGTGSGLFGASASSGSEWRERHDWPDTLFGSPAWQAKQDSLSGITRARHRRRSLRCERTDRCGGRQSVRYRARHKRRSLRCERRRPARHLWPLADAYASRGFPVLCKRRRRLARSKVAYADATFACSRAEARCSDSPDRCQRVQRGDASPRLSSVWAEVAAAVLGGASIA